MITEWVKYLMHVNREDGEITLDQLTGEELTPREIGRLFIEAKAHAEAANKLVKVIGEAFNEDKPLRVDGFLVWKGQKSKTVCVDPDGFAEWLEGHPGLASVLFNPNQVRIGQVPPSIREEFYEKQKYGVVETQAVSLEVLEGKK